MVAAPLEDSSSGWAWTASRVRGTAWLLLARRWTTSEGSEPGWVVDDRHRLFVRDGRPVGFGCTDGRRRGVVVKLMQRLARRGEVLLALATPAALRAPRDGAEGGKGGRQAARQRLHHHRHRRRARLLVLARGPPRARARAA